VFFIFFASFDLVGVIPAVFLVEGDGLLGRYLGILHGKLSQRDIGAHRFRITLVDKKGLY